MLVLHHYKMQIMDDSLLNQTKQTLIGLRIRFFCQILPKIYLPMIALLSDHNSQTHIQKLFVILQTLAAYPLVLIFEQKNPLCDSIHALTYPIPTPIPLPILSHFNY